MSRHVLMSQPHAQVLEFYEQSSDGAGYGNLYVAVPPAGLSLSALLAQVLSRALGCPFTLPLHPLLEVPDATQLSQLQPVLHAGKQAGITCGGCLAASAQGLHVARRGPCLFNFQ
jgi:hypothetical protein